MNLKQILEFLHEVEKLKQELRHSRLSNGRQESVAEHSRRLWFMVILFASNINHDINIEKALKISIIHDLNEAYVWDMPAFDSHHSQHGKSEMNNIIKLKERFNNPVMDEIYNLRLDYENLVSIEAKFVKSLDKLEVRIQHNESDISTWNDIEFPRSLFAADKYCDFDTFIREFNELVKEESRSKIIRESDKNIVDVEEEAEELRNNEI